MSLIDAAGGRVGAAVPVGSPDGLAYGRGSVWVVDGTDGKLFRVDPVTHAIIDHIDVGSDPTAVTVSQNGDVWVANVIGTRLEPSLEPILEEVFGAILRLKILPFGAYP